MIRLFTTPLKKVQLKFGFMLIGMALVALSSCKKTETDTNAYTAITVYNASPTAATYDVYLGDTKLNTAALPLGGSVAYSQQLVGAYNLKFTTAGRSESLITKSVNLTQNTYHSFFLVGKPNAFDGVLVTDDLTATSTTSAFVRFVNLSPDAPALFLSITGGAAIATSQTYKGVSAFVQVPAGSYSFDVKDNATSAVKTTLPGITLIANGHYTVIARGLIAPLVGTEIGLGAQIIANK